MSSRDSVTKAQVFEPATGDIAMQPDGEDWRYFEGVGWLHPAGIRDIFDDDPLQIVQRNGAELDLHLVERQPDGTYHGVALQRELDESLDEANAAITFGDPFNLEHGDALIIGGNVCEYDGPERRWRVDGVAAGWDTMAPFADGGARVVLRQDVESQPEVFRVAASLSADLRAVAVDMSHASDGMERFHPVNVREVAAGMLRQWPTQDELDIVDSEISARFASVTSDSQPPDQTRDSMANSATAQFRAAIALANEVGQRLGGADFEPRAVGRFTELGLAVHPQADVVPRTLDGSIPRWVGLWKEQATRLAALAPNATMSADDLLTSAELLSLAADQLAGFGNTIEPLARGGLRRSLR